MRPLSADQQLNNREAAERAAHGAISRAESYAAEGYEWSAARHLAIGYLLGRYELTPDNAVKFERLIRALENEAPVFEHRISTDFPDA